MPEEHIPSQSTDTGRTFVASIAAFVGDFLLNSLAGGIAFAVLFFMFALPVAPFADDLSGLYMLPLIGAILGIAMGGGQTFVEWFSDPEFVKTDSPLASSFFRLLEPRCVQLIRLIHHAATKDYTRARPGRLRRGLIGGCGGVLLGVFFWCAMSQTLRAVNPPLYVHLVLILVPASIFAIAGALTDSR